MAILRTVFVTSFIKLITLCSAFSAFMIIGMDSDLVNEDIKKLGKAIMSGDYQEVARSLSSLGSEELNRKINDVVAIDYALWFMEQESKYPQVVSLIKSSNSEIAQITLEIIDHLVLSRSLKPGEALQGVDVNPETWANNKQSNYQKIQQLLVQKTLEVASVFKGERQKILELLIEHGASCDFDSARPHVAQLWKVLAIRLEEKEISESLIKKFFESMAQYYPGSLDKLQNYLDSLIPNLDKVKEGLEVKGFTGILQILTEFLRSTALKRGKESAEPVIRRESRRNLMQDWTPERRLHYLRTGGLSSTSAESSSSSSSSSSAT